MVLLYLKHRIFFVCFVTYTINKPDSIIIVRVLFLYPSCEKQVNGNRIETAVILRIQSQIYELAEKGFPFPLCKYYECKCKCYVHESIAKENSDKKEHSNEREIKHLAGSRTQKLFIWKTKSS